MDCRIQELEKLILQAFHDLGYKKELFGLHDLRSGGATPGANSGLNESLFKRHGRWKTDVAKDSYVKDKLDAMLSVTLSMVIRAVEL